MIVYAFIMTLLVGAFIGSWLTILTSVYLTEREEKQAAMEKHPAGGRVGTDPFVPTILEYEK